jgi:hypothetical protein
MGVQAEVDLCGTPIDVAHEHLGKLLLFGLGPLWHDAVCSDGNEQEKGTHQPSRDPNVHEYSTRVGPLPFFTFKISPNAVSLATTIREQESTKPMLTDIVAELKDTAKGNPVVARPNRSGSREAARYSKRKVVWIGPPRHRSAHGQLNELAHHTVALVRRTPQLSLRGRC